MSQRNSTLLLRGNFHRPCGFTVINRRLEFGLRRQGFYVTTLPVDGAPASALPERLPDIYLFHGDPYDLDHAPGHVNACFLHWEYLSLPPSWVRQINAAFDLVLAPSQHSRDVYASSGIDLPIALFPAAVDQVEFHPSVAPWQAPTRKSFRFVHVGGAHARRGTDVLLKAYAAEFSAADDVVLILKAFQYQHHRTWLQEQLSALAKPGAPEVVFTGDMVDSVAGMFTAADVGVYPLRAECFGLPVLECIASGRPVIVTGGTALDDFCTPANADFVRATVVPDGDHTHLEPDVLNLQALMRAAYERGKPDASTQQDIAATVAGRTWDHSMSLLATALRDAAPRKRHIPMAAPTSGSLTGAAPAGELEWMITSLRQVTVRAGVRSIVGRGGTCLEQFRESNPGHRILCELGAAFEDVLLATNSERELCGLAPLPEAPYDRWQRWQEQRLADHLVVFGQPGLDSYVQRGLDASKLIRLPPVAVLPTASEPAARTGRLRFLFVSERPFLDGIRLLFEAWAAADLTEAELVCATDRAILRSAPLLRILVRHKSITVQGPPLTLKAYADLMVSGDCLVHPTWLDGLSAAAITAMACQRPALVSSHTSVAERLTDGENGMVLAELAVGSLAAALTGISDRRHDLTRMGVAAYDLARSWTEEACAAEFAHQLNGLDGGSR